MGDYVTPAAAEFESGSQFNAFNDSWGLDFPFSDDEEPSGEKVECRICHEEDFIGKLEAPCGCSGSLKLAHRKCIQQWCNEKRSTICEICHQPYEAGYTAPLHEPPAEETVIDISEDNEDPDASDDDSPPSYLEAATAEHLLEVDHYDECATASGIRTAFIRSTVLLFLAVQMMRHAFSLIDEEDHQISNVISIFLLRFMAFLMPVYVLAWLINLWLRRKERLEEAREAAERRAVTLVVPSGQGRAPVDVPSDSEESPHES